MSTKVRSHIRKGRKVRSYERSGGSKSYISLDEEHREDPPNPSEREELRREYEERYNKKAKKEKYEIHAVADGQGNIESYNVKKVK
ncbi:MAG: hypothetical protein M1113_00315 [Candidatus Thermoplasmatota archaeon]|nr:hypothetical protein [Candidatus Thermoplasmatota archaeon]